MQAGNNEIVFIVSVVTFLILSLLGFIITVLFLYQRKQIAYRNDLNQIRTEYEKNLLTTQLEIQESTLKNISREIHDNIGLSLTMAKLNLNTIQLEDHKNTLVKVHSSIDFISKAIVDLSSISKSLNSDIILNHGLINALETEIKTLNYIGKVSIDFQVSGSPIFLEAQKELVAFRVVQEAINNCIKHSNAKQVWLNLDYLGDELNLSIKDDGEGFNVLEKLSSRKNARNGSGLINIQNRAKLILGSSQIESSIGEGTTIKVIIPYGKEYQEH